MNLLTYRAFSTELLKIANDLGDADVRSLLAERKGEEYLKGGELPTNKIVPGDRPVPAGDGAATKIANYALAAPSMLKAHKKEQGPYQTVRDTGLKALGGAAAGAGSMRLFHDMMGRHPTPHKYRVSAGIGAGIALVDKAFRHRQDIKDTVRRKPKQKLAFVQQNTASTFRSPGDALASAQTVGKFQNRVHQSAAKVPGLLGKSMRSLT
jgi:hypothetical protein